MYIEQGGHVSEKRRNADGQQIKLSELTWNPNNYLIQYQLTKHMRHSQHDM